MRAKSRRSVFLRAFTLIEVLIVALMLGVIMLVALPSYITSVLTVRQGTANGNARELAAAVQAKAVGSGAYNTTLSSYSTDMGGSIPINPCTGSNTGYVITATTMTATVTASSGSNCGTWTPLIFSLTL
jgi:prepilin-type N-terminal cleavage/methylation domain-containing protein